jgi:GTPase SAR1 family protein
MNDIEKYAKNDVLKILVGNKSDLISKRKVSTEQGQDLADHYNIPFLETSAKDNSNIEQLFIDSARAFIRKQANNGNNNLDKRKKNGNEKIDLTGTILPTERKKKCCG